MTSTETLKRNTRIEYTYAAGKVVPGKILRADAHMPGWYQVELTDEGGAYRCCVHGGQVRSLTNRH